MFYRQVELSHTISFPDRERRERKGREGREWKGREGKGREDSVKSAKKLRLVEWIMSVDAVYVRSRFFRIVSVKDKVR